MNKQEFIEKLKQNMPEGLNKIEIAKYIYVQLGKEKAFDEKYFFGNSKTRKKIYRLAEKTENNTDKVAENKKIICVSLTYLYRDILNEFDINSVTGEEGEHKYPIICLDNGKLIKADLQLDLYNIQTQSKTEYFGTRQSNEMYNVEPLNERYLLEIDKKIGYIEKDEDYKDDIINKIKEDVKDKNANEALSLILSNNKINNFERKLEPVEIWKYYKSLLNQIVYKHLNKKIFAFNCYREKENREKDYTMCIYSTEKDSTRVYLFSAKENRFLNIEMSKLGQLVDQGLVLGIKGREQGLRQLEKMLQKTRIKNEKMFE